MTSMIVQLKFEAHGFGPDVDNEDVPLKCVISSATLTGLPTGTCLHYFD